MLGCSRYVSYTDTFVIRCLRSELRPGSGCGKGLGEYLVRVGPYRMLYDVYDGELVVAIMAVKRRAGDTYRK